MPIGPLSLPGLVPTRSGRRSRLVYHWRARDLSLTALTGQVGTFTRNSAGGLIVDRFGNFFAPVHSQPRFEAVDWEGTGVMDDVALLMEAAGTNVVKWNTDYANAVWVQGGTVGIVANAIVRGALSLTELEDNAAGTNERLEQSLLAGTFSTANPKYITIPWSKHASAPANGAGVDLYDSSALVNRMAAQIQANGDGSPNITMVVGALVAIRYVGGGVYLLTFRATGVINGNNHLLIIRPCFADADQGKVYYGPVQVEEGTGPSTLKLTGATGVGTLSETLTFPFNLPPQTPTSALTLYAKYIDRFTYESHAGGGVSARIIEIGGSPIRSMLYVTASKPTIYSQYDGSNSRSANPGIGAQAHNDRIEIRGTVRTDGSVFAETRQNAGAVFSAVSSSFAGPYPSAYTNALLSFGGEAGATNNRLALLEVKVALGESTIDQMAEVL